MIQLSVGESKSMLLAGVCVVESHETKGQDTDLMLYKRHV